MTHPVVLTNAISGSLANRDQCPAIPYTPAEYAAEARRVVDEGGVHVHVHARTPDGQPSHEAEDYGAIAQAIRDEVGDALIMNFSTGTVGVSVERRIAYLEACRPEVAALNMGSMNYAKYSSRRRDFVFSTIFANPFEEIVELLRAMRRLGIRPEHECFDVGHVGSIAPLVDMGLLEGPVHADFVMGVTGGIPPTARNLQAMADNLADVTAAVAVAPELATAAATSAPERAGAGGAGPPTAAHWGVIGIGRVQWQMIAAAAALGGSVRAGLEDNLYLPDGTMARSNGELVAEARRLVVAAGRRPATVHEARAMLGLPAPARAD